MSANSDAEFVVAGRFADEGSARAAADAIRARGGDDQKIDIAQQTISRAAGRARGEGRFVWRLVWIVVCWSVVGGIIGGALGAAVWWAGLGGGGRLAMVLQIIGWAIFGHLIAGMWAGYALLADRSEPEFAPDSRLAPTTVVVVGVRCRTRGEIERVREQLEACGAIDVEVIAQPRSVSVT